MKAEERNKIIQAYFLEDLQLLLKKGHDYSGDDDSLANFRDFGFEGIIVRIGDKFNRLKNFVKQKKFKVSNESVIDTLRDLRNYAYLAQILYEEEQLKGLGNLDDGPMTATLEGFTNEIPDVRFKRNHLHGGRTVINNKGDSISVSETNE